ncbi:hypothetical protein ABI59_07080 [Acidobacteria bacterium Mor1]|nr:hypothetical protein ABI59_07080 [Acidobacteria bacterium Mor1]
MRSNARFFWILLLLAAPLLGANNAAALETIDAAMQKHSASGALGDQIERFGGSARNGVWIGWLVDSVESGGAICSYRNSKGCHCVLEGNQEGWTMHGGDHDGVVPVPSGQVAVLVRANSRGIDRIRTYDAACKLDFGGATLHVIEGVDDRDSLGWLETQVDTPARKLREDVVAAIAQHEDSKADRLLRGFLEGDGPRKLRENAAFWLGAARGTAGYDALVATYRKESDSKFRKELIFPIHLCKDERATDFLVDKARKDDDREVRKQALFWLAQRAGERAEQSLIDAIDDDPMMEVRQQAVFALSQLPEDRAVPALMEIARGEDRHPEIRKKALFWLGQIDDPRVLDFFEEILEE